MWLKGKQIALYCNYMHVTSGIGLNYSLGVSYRAHDDRLYCCWWWWLWWCCLWWWCALAYLFTTGWLLFQLVRCMGVGSWVHKFAWQWVGLDWVSYLVGWVGSGSTIWTHGQLWAIQKKWSRSVVFLIASRGKREVGLHECNCVSIVL